MLHRRGNIFLIEIDLLCLFVFACRFMLLLSRNEDINRMREERTEMRDEHELFKKVPFPASTASSH